jgi:hypothetical protein
MRCLFSRALEATPDARVSSLACLKSIFPHTIKTYNSPLFTERILTKQKTTSTMVQELSYNVISHVIESWEQLRRIKDYEEVAGAVLFQRCVLLSCCG